MAYQEFGWGDLIFRFIAKDTRQDETRQFYKYLAFHCLSAHFPSILNLTEDRAIPCNFNPT